jgi:hypothetical protein
MLLIKYGVGGDETLYRVRDSADNDRNSTESGEATKERILNGLKEGGFWLAATPLVKAGDLNKVSLLISPGAPVSILELG